MTLLSPMDPEGAKRSKFHHHFGTLCGVLLGTFSKQVSSTFFKTLPGTILADFGAKRVPEWSLFGALLEPFSKDVDLAFLVDPPMKIKGFWLRSKLELFWGIFRRRFQGAFGKPLVSNFGEFGDPLGDHFGTKFAFFGGPFSRALFGGSWRRGRRQRRASREEF